MLEYLYLTLIAPLEAGMKLALDFGHSWTDSWGIGLIFMSLCVNICLLPLYHLAETWQEAERRVQHSMEKKLKEIRECYKGQERYALMRTLYRQHGYHPIFAVRTSFGFLIQVPFFFAAYHFLSNYEPLRGVSFGPLTNLADPDGLLVIGGLAINTLPFIMTVINLVSALVYTHRLSKRDKIQLYTIAALFLVLLYDAAAGLVFYWTCNNIFSLLKNCVYEQFKILDHGMKPAKSKKQQQKTVLSSFSVPNTPAKYLPRAAWLWPLLILVMSVLVLAFDGKIKFDNSFKLIMQYVTRFGLAALCLSCAIRQLPERKKRQTGSWVSAVIILAAVLFQLGLLFSWIVTGYASSNAGKQLVAASLLVIFSSFSGIWGRALPSIPEAPKGVMLSALCWIVALVCWYVPINLFVSDPIFFEREFAPSAAGLTWLSFLLLLTGALCYRLAGQVLRWCMLLLTSWISLAGALYTFVFPKSYGVITGFQLQYEQRLYESTDLFFDLALLAVVALLIFFALRRSKIPALRILMQAGASVTMLVSLVVLAITPIPTLEKNTGDTDLPEYHEQLFGLSRDGINVVVFMLDMFAGDHLGRMLEQHPDLREELDGFVWYPDTVSPGCATTYSIPSMLAGDTLLPERNKQEDGYQNSLMQRVHEGMADFFNSLSSRNFSIVILDHSWLNPSLLQQKMKEPVLALNKVSPAYRNRWAAEHGVSSRGSGLPGLFPAAVGVFNITPRALRRHIYRKGKWLHTVYVLDTAVQDYALLDGLPQWFSTSQSGNTYKFIANDLTHNPWRLDARTCMPTAEDPYPDTAGASQKVDGIVPEHYIADLCCIRALTRWFHWLKEEGLYDNTQIIIASDHDHGDSLPLSQAFDGPAPGRANPLLLVKNRYSRGTVLEDTSLMRSSDIRTLIEKDIAGDSWNGKEEWRNSQRERWHVIGDLNRGSASDTGYNLSELWKITGTMFKKENWERVK